MELPATKRTGRIAQPSGCKFVKSQELATRIHYKCPCCASFFDSLLLLGEHIDHHLNGIAAVDSTYDATDDEMMQIHATTTINPADIIVAPVPQLSSSSATPATPTPTPASASPAPRTHDEAILYCCKKLNACEEEKIKSLCLVDTLALKPIAITDQEGTEHNALTHTSVIAKLVESHDSIKAITPSKRRYQDMLDKSSLCVRCVPEAAPGLDNLLSVSPYTNLLSQRSFVEIPEHVCNLLNSDWEFFPKIRFYTAMVLAGTIILNVPKNQAAILNTVEVYGRTRPVDAFSEPFGQIKGSSQTTSMPLTAIHTRYPGLCPTTLMSSEGSKLVVGTKVSNVLVTSSMRLDVVEKLSLGGITTNFTILGNKESVSCKIFLDSSMLRQATEMLNQPNVNRLSDSMILAQLRAIRSKFHTADAYILCRATGPLTMSHLHQPCSLFTLSEFKRIPAAAIIRSVATAVLKNGQTARISRKQVEDTHALCSGSSKNTMDGILDLFGPNDDSLHILGNIALNRKLELLADDMTSNVVAANIVTAKYITSTFSTFH